MEKILSRRGYVGRLNGRFARLLSIDLVRFLMVGVVGFAVNYIVLIVLKNAGGLPLLASQLVGAQLAIISNFFFHDRWTYRRAEPMPVYKRFLKFEMTAWSGALITTVVLLYAVHNLGAKYSIGLIAGAVVALVWNFLWTKYFVWRAPADDGA